MTIKALQEAFQKRLNPLYDKGEINSFFYLLSEAYLHKTRLDIALEPNEVLNDDDTHLFLKALEQLSKEYPIQYIIGKTEFMDLAFEVNEQVLIPRPETEELIRWILSADPKAKSILDIGTGSGCIPIVLANSLPNTKVTSIDISEKAIQVAKRNATKNNVAINFLQHDILQIEVLEESYDIIVSNPPYVRESEKSAMNNNVLKYEPEMALFVSDEDPLIFYRHIASLAIKSLHTDGVLYFEINQYLGSALYKLLEAVGFKKIELRKDMYGADRMIRAVKN
ncbi:peptide chain release factor N(5)-glutamine methyltransferase [Lutimonas halocynthiae]|uniref:peptide chain release factor N(5)-glutamine methyltransferase n=1 Tax=Lutimonas halocynthiae TaxID=1446477 RepID=UPI0025B501E2|nr:peptide chain release factor N(5)-glutamine methyltransferase [Lutimonas halocynthiae]MDN3644544.1 peptide chain release factor N(5)-glutamine methyltransferase [Lutimonas halocynthiae]